MVRCAACGTVGASQRCGACRYAQYCNPACQREHWKAGHKQECKRICTAVPLSAEAVRSLSLPDLVDFICSPGVLDGDVARRAAESLLHFHDARALTDDVSLRVTKGLLDVVERLYEKCVGHIDVLFKAMVTVIHPGIVSVYIDEGMLVLLQALRSVLNRTSCCADASRDDEKVADESAAGAGSRGTCAAHTEASASGDVMTQVHDAVICLLYIVDYVVGCGNTDNCAIRLLVDNDALPLVVTALRKYSSVAEGVLVSTCKIITDVSYLSCDSRSAFVRAGAVPALLHATHHPGQTTPMCAIAALSSVLLPTVPEDPSVVDAVRRDLAHIVDAFYCGLTNVVDSGKESSDDGAMLTHTGRLIWSITTYLSREIAEYGTPISTLRSFPALLYGDGKPGRLPALVNAVRATTRGFVDGNSSASAKLGGYFISAISLVIDAAGWASCQAAVEAGVIPALLAALRKHGESASLIVCLATSVLQKLQRSGLEGCCSECIFAELSVRGTTQKLLRRLRDVWRAKAAAASDAAVDAEIAEDVSAAYTTAEKIVGLLSAVLANMTSHV